MTKALLSTFVCSLTCAASPAQDPMTVRPVLVGCVPVHTRAAEPGEADYGTWAAGTDYKVRFDGGMTFVPYLGRDYPHNQPFAWRTTSVRVGETELLTAGRPPECKLAETRVEYSHGPVIEAYDVLAHGLEQTFVLAKRPAASGDLHISGTVTTALSTPPVLDTHTDLEFVDAQGRAVLRYGRAIAIDADGDRFAMTTACRGNRITLRLPAADLARADFPLTVDPLLTAELIAPTSAFSVDDCDVGVTDEGVSYRVMMAYARHASAADGDVLVRIGIPDLSIHYSVHADLSTFTDSDRPSVGYVAGADRWVVAWQSLLVQSATMQLRAKVLVAESTTFSSGALSRLGAAGTHAWRPRVGGTADGSTSTKALLVFQHEATGGTFANVANSEVHALLFDTTVANGNFAPASPVLAASFADHEFPAVNRAAEGTGSFSWLMVCQAFDDGVATDDWDLIGRKIAHDGTVLGLTWASTLGNMHKIGADVDGRDGRFCVFFATASTTYGKVVDTYGTSLRTERIDWPHGQTGPSSAPHAPFELVASASRDLMATGIAYDAETRSHWYAAWVEQAATPTARMAGLGHRGRVVDSVVTVHQATGGQVGPIAIAHDSRDGDTQLLYQVTAGAGAQVFGRQFTRSSSGAIALVGPSCSPASISWTGPAVAEPWHNRRIGSQLSGPVVSGAPANALHLLLFGTAAANLPLVDPIVGPGCALLVPIGGPDHLGFGPLAIGSSVAWTLPLPETLAPLTIHVQDWILDPAEGVLRGTDRIMVPLVH